LSTFSFVAFDSNCWNPSRVIVTTGEGAAPKLRGDQA
jgi:hypothetical protein